MSARTSHTKPTYDSGRPESPFNKSVLHGTKKKESKLQNQAPVEESASDKQYKEYLFAIVTNQQQKINELEQRMEKMDGESERRLE
jgi:hypothetical protein